MERNIVWLSGNCKRIYISWCRVSAGGGCEAAVTARARCGWVKFRECSELLYGKRLPPRIKGTVHKIYVRPAILHGSESWCLKESEIGIP